MKWQHTTQNVQKKVYILIWRGKTFTNFRIRSKGLFFNWTTQNIRQFQRKTTFVKKSTKRYISGAKRYMKKREKDGEGRERVNPNPDHPDRPRESARAHACTHARTHARTHTLSLCVSVSNTHTRTFTFSLSLSVSLSLCLCLSLSLSLSVSVSVSLSLSLCDWPSEEHHVVTRRHVRPQFQGPGPEGLQSVRSLHHVTWWGDSQLPARPVGVLGVLSQRSHVTLSIAWTVTVCILEVLLSIAWTVTVCILKVLSHKENTSRCL